MVVFTPGFVPPSSNKHAYPWRRTVLLLCLTNNELHMWFLLAESHQLICYTWEYHPIKELYELVKFKTLAPKRQLTNSPHGLCRIHKGSRIIPILSHINPIPHFKINFFKVHSNVLRLGPPKRLFSVGLPVKILKALLPFSNLAIWPVHLNLLDLITLTILGERYKLRILFYWRQNKPNSFPNQEGGKWKAARYTNWHVDTKNEYCTFHLSFNWFYIFFYSYLFLWNAF